MILVIFLEARPRLGAIKATQATDLMVFPAPGPAGSGRAQPPRWLLSHRLPDSQRPNGARSRREAPLSQYVTEPGDSCGQIHPFLPTRRRPTVDHSLVGGGAQRHALRACLPDGHKPQCPSTPCPPVDGEVVARITQFAYCSAGRPNAPPLPVSVSRREGPPTFRRRKKWVAPSALDMRVSSSWPRTQGRSMRCKTAWCRSEFRKIASSCGGSAEPKRCSRPEPP